jgi:plastocyanin
VVCAVFAAAGVPALALGQADPPSTAGVVVSDTGFSPPTVDILVGGKVNFSYPSGTGVYNVVWDRGSPEPASCEQTQGPVWGYGTTLPWWMQPAPWAGNCTFTKAGTYTYHSGVDPDKMKGTVVVHADATPTATPTVTVTPTATPSDARIVAHDSASPARNWFQDAKGDANDNSVTIKAGETVTFDYPAGASAHNVTFPSAPKPALCPQTKPSTGGTIDPDNAPPMPAWAQPPGWEGSCTFDTPGTYTFVCSTHPVEMTGTVVVEPGSEPTVTPTATPTETATPTATPTSPPTGRAGIVAHDQTTPTPKNWFQDAASSDPADNSVSVNKGATVDFSYPAGASAHNVVFTTAPTSCVQKTGVAIYPAPPLPAYSLPAGWSGECTFDTPGVYSFVCQAHPTEMTGSVVVKNEDGTEPTPVPTTSPTATPTVTATPEPPRDTTPAKVAKLWAAIDKPKVKAMTVSSFLKGKLKIVARCVSAGSGTMTLTVSKAQARRIGLKGTKLGSAKASCDSHGRFTVKLKPNNAAEAALDGWRGSVKATAKLELAGPAGQTTATRTIKLKGKGRAR